MADESNNYKNVLERVYEVQYNRIASSKGTSIILSSGELGSFDAELSYQQRSTLESVSKYLNEKYPERDNPTCSLDDVGYIMATHDDIDRMAWTRIEKTSYAGSEIVPRWGCFIWNDVYLLHHGRTEIARKRALDHVNDFLSGNELDYNDFYRYYGRNPRF